MTVEEAAQFLILVGAAVTAIGVIAVAVRTLVRWFDRINNQLARVEHKVSPNGNTIEPAHTQYTVHDLASRAVLLAETLERRMEQGTQSFRREAEELHEDIVRLQQIAERNVNNIARHDSRMQHMSARVDSISGVVEETRDAAREAAVNAKRIEGELAERVKRSATFIDQALPKLKEAGIDLGEYPPRSDDRTPDERADQEGD